MVNFGDIYIVKVYFKGTTGPFKRRPVLIVEDSEDSTVTFVEITTTPPKIPPKYFDQFKVEISKWKEAGLKEASWIKCHKGNMHRARKDRMIKKIGSIDNETMLEVMTKIINQ